MKLFGTCLLCILALTTGCAVVFPKPYTKPACVDSSPAKVQQEDKEQPTDSKPQQQHKDKRLGPRFKTRLDMMMCSLHLQLSSLTAMASQIDFDERFEEELQAISNNATCPKLEVACVFPRTKKPIYSLSLYGFEQEYAGDAFLSQDVVFEGITFLQGDYVRSRVKLDCVGAIFRLSWEELPHSILSEEPLVEKAESLKLTPHFDIGLQYLSSSVRLKSEGISRVDSANLTRPFFGGGLKLTFYDRVNVFAEGAAFAIVPPFFDGFRISGGLSCYITENLEVSVAYLQQQYYFYLWHKPGFKGWSFALTFRF